MTYWLMKSEPDEFSIDDLAECPKKTAHHSNTKPPGVAGIMEIVAEGYPDHTAFDPNDPHYDPKSDPDKPRWFMVDVRFVEKFPHYIPLSELKKQDELADMKILQRGNRLSITPLSSSEWKHIVAMGRKK
jgi:predicted RNA-binding protein with PUA-like domain